MISLHASPKEKACLRKAAAASLGLPLAACYNPLNKATADRYSETCAQAESSGQMDVAEEACRRALINAQIGHLGAVEESRALYNYARVKQRTGKIEEAEELLKKSLQLEETISPPDMVKIGRRLANLSLAIGAQGRLQDAWPYLERLLPLADQYTGQEREFLRNLFMRYANEYRQSGKVKEADRLQEKAVSLSKTARTEPARTPSPHSIT